MRGGRSRFHCLRVPAAAFRDRRTARFRPGGGDAPGRGAAAPQTTGGHAVIAVVGHTDLTEDAQEAVGQALLMRLVRPLNDFFSFSFMPPLL
ncbi:predicted protein [Streptomyces albidoflavus]|nr:predicted protein [Streptomyces albidoflavus]